MGRQMHFTNPEIEAKLEQWTRQTGRPAGELVEDLMASYFNELADARQALDDRHDDMKSRKVKLIPGERTIT